MVFGTQVQDAPGDQITFTIDLLSEVRRFVSARAERAGLIGQRATDAILAANELATNSVRHAGGDGTLRIWRQDGTLVCEVSDAGHIADPLVGQRRPAPDQTSGRGLWIVNQLCDRVSIRSSPEGTTVRMQIGIH